MKKIFTFAAIAALATAANAASGFKVTILGNEVANGSVVKAECGKYDEYIDPEDPEWNSYSLELDPEFFVTADADGAYTAVIENLYKDNVKWCGWGTTTCAMINGGEKATRNAVLKANMPENMHLDYAPYLSAPLEAGYSVSVPVSVSIYETANPSNSLNFELHMNYSHGVSVKGIEADDVRFAVIDGKVVAGAPVEVYNLQGQKVANVNLHGVFVVKAGNKTAKLFVR